jgi:hypothetical protein
VFIRTLITGKQGTRARPLDRHGRQHRPVPLSPAPPNCPRRDNRADRKPTVVTPWRSRVGVTPRSPVGVENRHFPADRAELFSIRVEHGVTVRPKSAVSHRAHRKARCPHRAHRGGGVSGRAGSPAAWRRRAARAAVRGTASTPAPAPADPLRGFPGSDLSAATAGRCRRSRMAARP